MFEQDYIMRQIKEMIRALIKLLFHIDTESPSIELMQDVEEKYMLSQLLQMIDDGKVNDAEDQLYEMIADADRDNLKIALLFYAHLNEKSDEFLEDHNFSRDEIRSGLKEVVSKYGLESMADVFLEDE